MSRPGHLLGDRILTWLCSAHRQVISTSLGWHYLSNMALHIYIYIYIYIQTHTCICINKHIYIYIYIYIYILAQAASCGDSLSTLYEEFASLGVWPQSERRRPRGDGGGHRFFLPRGPKIPAHVRGNHLSNTTFLTQVFFKSDK